MSNSIHSLQTARVQTQTEQTVQPPKKAQTKPQNSIPRDTVTISKASQQAHARNTNGVASQNKNNDGHTP